MGKIDYIIRAVSQEPWAILPAKLDDIMALLELRMRGITLSAEDVAARIGDKKINDDWVVQGGSAVGGGMIAVLPLRGVISHRMGMLDEVSGGISTERFTKRLRAAMAEESVGTVVIDIDSPGGRVPGIPELAKEIRDARKKKRIIAVANHMAASGALWLGSAASEFVAIPSAQVGSLGVMAIHVDRSKELEDAGIKVTLVRAGENKNLENPYEPLSEKGMDAIQERIDRVYDEFIRDVSKGRSVPVQEVREKYGQGAMFDAKQARDIGMVDRIATFDEVLSDAAKPRRSSVTVSTSTMTMLDAGEMVKVIRADDMAGVVPKNVSENLAPEDTEWKKPTLSDFTDKNWEDLSDDEKRRIAMHYAWAPAMPPENFTDLKLPHHRPPDGYVVPNAVRNAKSRLPQSTVIPANDKPKVERHLDDHMEKIEARREKQNAKAQIEVERVRFRMKGLR